MTYQNKRQIASIVVALLFCFASGNVYSDSKKTDDRNQSLSVGEIESLLFMREEEKMARDVYLISYDKWDDEMFENTANSEQDHMDAMKSLLDKYDLADPAVDVIGIFSDSGLQTLYDELVTRAENSRMDALLTGALIEEVDIRDIQKAIDETEHKDIVSVYENLLKGSRNHLRAFVGKIENEGIVYKAQVLTQEEVDEIVDSPMERGGL
ncbi:MAG: DUF2202 domain-containing protein [Gammaproteobacteria bacterium]